MLLHVLQSLYEPDKPLPADLQQTALDTLHDIELFALASPIYHLIAAGNRLEEAPMLVRDRLKERYRQGFNHSLYIKQQTESLLGRFEQRELAVIPLKGTCFAQQYYGHVAARLTSDIDLLVHRDELDHAIHCVESAGFEWQGMKDHHARLYRKQNGLVVELHWTLDKPYWSKLQPELFWNHSEPMLPYAYVRQLSPQHTFYFICLHGARHQMDSPRYILDIAQVLHTCGSAIDLDALIRQAKSDLTYTRIRAVLSIVYSVLPYFQRVKPLPFKPIETYWDYETIRSLAHKRIRRTKRYFGYKLFFKHFIFDSLKHQMISIKKSY